MEMTGWEILKIRRQIFDKRSELIGIMKQAITTINKMPTAKFRRILWLRYIEGKTWNTVAKECGYDETYLRGELHHKALREADAAVEEPEEQPKEEPEEEQPVEAPVEVPETPEKTTPEEPETAPDCENSCACCRHERWCMEAVRLYPCREYKKADHADAYLLRIFNGRHFKKTQKREEHSKRSKTDRPYDQGT